METLILFIKGVLIGIGKIIPGVSGSMIAITLGVYEKMIYSLSHLFIDFKKNISFLIRIGLGIVFSIFIFSNIIIFSLNNYFIYTMSLFIGLIIGGIPSIVKITKKEKNLFNIILLMIPFLLLFLLDYLSTITKISININVFTLFILGIIEAISMIIPGISGTAIMLLLGVYDVIISLFAGLSNITYIIAFVFGVTIGIIILSKIMNYFMNKYKIKCFYIILGFIISSLFIILKQIAYINCSIIELFICISLIVLGTIISYIFE